MRKKAEKFSSVFFCGNKYLHEKLDSHNVRRTIKQIMEFDTFLPFNNEDVNEEFKELNNFSIYED